MRIPSRDGVDVAVYDLGGDGPPLLLAHATGFHGRVWDGFADRLAERFHVWSFDSRGHGGSGPGEMRWTAMAEDVLAVVDGLGLEPGQLHGVGHSLGGGLCVLAERARPGTFRSLYLYEPAIFEPRAMDGGPGGGNVMAEGAARRRAVFPSRDAAYDNYAGKPPLNELSPACLRAYVDHGFADVPDGTVTLKCTPEAEAACFRGAEPGDAWYALADIDVPATVAKGGLDAPGPGMFGEAVARRLRADLVVLDNLAHFGPLADPDTVAESVFSRF